MISAETRDLYVAAIAKSNTLAGLAEALEYGKTRVLRINGLDHIYAGDFVVTVNINGTVMCRGHVVNSTCRDLAYDVIRADRAH
jgi:hypothetical protein